MAFQQDQDFLQDVDIVALVSEYVTLRRHGREYQGLCPFHSERTPSFSVNPEKGFWYCHGCHEGGNAVSFLAKIEGVGAGQARRMLAERQGLALSPAGTSAPERDGQARERLLAACAEAARFYQERLFSEEAAPARTYLRGRGIDKSCAADFGLGFAPGSHDSLYQHLAHRGFTLEELDAAGLCASGEFGPYDRMRQRLIIPVADGRGRVIAFGGRAIGDGTPKYLNSPETSLFHKSRTLYLLHRARRGIQREGKAVVVEGYLDALMAHHYGIDNVVATLGTAITAQHVQLLQRLAKKLIFALDADAAGIRAVERSVPLFAESGMEIGVASFPAGMDPDAFLRSYGPDLFRERLGAAVGVVEYRLAMILKSGNLSTPEGKTAALQECTKVLGSVSSPFLRDRYVDDLARLWAGTQAPGETLLDNIEVIREEIARQVRTQMGARKRSVSHRLADAPASRPQMESEQARAELELLAAAIKKPSLVYQFGDGLSGEHFQTASHRKLWERVQEMGPPEEWLSSVEDEELIQAAARVMARSEEMVDEEMALVQLFQDCQRKVMDFDRRMRLEELRRKFGEMSSGVENPDDLSEYYELSRYFKHRGGGYRQAGFS